MRRHLMLIASLLVIFELVGAAPVNAGPGVDSANYAIAKSRKGKYKSGVLNADCPAPTGGSCDNPQVQTKTIDHGHTATFYVRVKNNSASDADTTMHANGNSAGFSVQYLLGTDFTNQITDPTSCPAVTVPAEGKILLVVKITNDTAVRGADRYFAIAGFNPACTQAVDVVYAHVKAG